MVNYNSSIYALSCCNKDLSVKEQPYEENSIDVSTPAHSQS